MHIFSTKPSFRPTDQDTNPTSRCTCPVGTPGIEVARGTLELSRFEGAQHRELAVTVGTERWERERERERRSERVSERERGGGGVCVCGVCVCVCACVCACVRACELCCSLILDRLAGHICICKQFSILVPVFVLPR